MPVKTLHLALPTSLTTLAGMVASQTADLPLPSIQLMAAGFLSVQKFPLTATTCSSGKWCCSLLRACSVPCRQTMSQSAYMRCIHTHTHTDSKSHLRDHIHPHGISSLGMEADVEISPSQTNQQLLESSKPANSNHTVFHEVKTSRHTMDTEPLL